MRPPHEYLERIALVAGGPEDLIAALGDNCSSKEANEILRLAGAGLPPVTSLSALAVMTGYNPGFIWSLLRRPRKHYRVFEIPKGRTKRQIEAPRVALKLIQKWLSIHFERAWLPHSAVHGFVRGRSHLSAASVHLSSSWVASVDIKNFFPSTNENEVIEALVRLGYRDLESLSAIKQICCFEGRLSQGAPSSPVLSNIALHRIDKAVAEIASRHSARFTRYADDIVLSGYGAPPNDIFGELTEIFSKTSWRLSEEKRYIAQLPQRLKVHGLLVHGNELRLSKGYRNRIRAYRHLIGKEKIEEKDLRKIYGHLNYAGQVEKWRDMRDKAK